VPQAQRPFVSNHGGFCFIKRRLWANRLSTGTGYLCVNFVAKSSKSLLIASRFGE
jgi:hypothetical protein